MFGLEQLLARALRWRFLRQGRQARQERQGRQGQGGEPQRAAAASGRPPGRLDPGQAAAAEPVTLLAILRTAAERATLEQIAAPSGWTLHLTDSYEQARALLAAAAIPLVVVDRDLPGADWRQLVPALAGLPHAPCILLASAVADEYLWLEISRHGGHDILPKPFEREAVTRVVTFAWAWRRSTLAGGAAG